MGYDGQVTFIQRDFSACYVCENKATAKGYATCTIRDTPDKPIHCIVWAKYLFGLLFGDNVSDDLLSGEESLKKGE
jgi:ubiquitin-like 1-activating enzyme E1 B